MCVDAADARVDVDFVVAGVDVRANINDACVVLEVLLALNLLLNLCDCGWCWCCWYVSDGKSWVPVIVSHEMKSVCQCWCSMS